MNLESRFFKTDDPHTDFFVYELNKTWWSRFYEYEWCKNFIHPNDIILDAASGVFHPFKYYCVGKCKEIYACDIDPLIDQDLRTIENCPEEFADKIQVLSELQSKIENQFCSINSMPYKDNFFDKVFCISVLEHLPDFWHSISRKKSKLCYNEIKMTILSIGKKMISESIKEFRRVLKPGGQLIMTFDYPRVNLNYLEKILISNNFNFLGKLDKNMPDNALFADNHKLYCFRMVVEKMI